MFLESKQNHGNTKVYGNTTYKILMMTEHINPPWNFSWVVSEKLAAMAWPQTEANLQYIFQQGVRHLVTLSPEKLPPAHKCPDLAWTVIGIEEFEAPSIDQIQEFIRICEQCDKNKQVSKVYQLYHMYIVVI